jgi:hypothetical protein
MKQGKKRLTQSGIAEGRFRYVIAAYKYRTRRMALSRKKVRSPLLV